MPTVVARLPTAERAAFKEPLGEVYTSTERLLSDVDGPLVAVGDVVLAHLGRAGVTPTVAVIDGRTERGAVDDWVREARPAAATERTVENPPGTITAELVAGIESGLQSAATVRIVVSGEEDLAVLPALLLAPRGATIVYGQPGEGMVAVPVDEGIRETARELLARTDRDREFWESIG